MSTPLHSGKLLKAQKNKINLKDIVMSKKKVILLLLLVTGLMIVCVPEISAQQAKSIIFQDVRVFDGTKIVPIATVVVQDGIIMSIIYSIDFAKTLFPFKKFNYFKYCLFSFSND